ncbi:MAG: hypothetical protein IJN06_03135 [Bacteroidales bacterium]|nr:hypothetical protein [Bacteroidales bacterium]
MKRIDDIEKMGLEELEAVAMAGNTSVPQGLEERIKERILAREMTRLPVGEKGYATGRYCCCSGSGTYAPEAGNGGGSVTGHF